MSNNNTVEEIEGFFKFMQYAKAIGYDITTNDVAAFLKGEHLPSIVPSTAGLAGFEELPGAGVAAQDRASAEALGLKPVEDRSKPRNKYDREIVPGLYVDIYDVLAAWDVTDQAIGHAIKKQLQAGDRGVKSRRRDITEAIDSLKRALDLPFVGK
jgi:hypothetical protein